MNSKKKARGLFVSHRKAFCSIYESGKMVYEALRGQNSFQLDYTEISFEQRTLPCRYDFYLFNYHYLTMSWLNVRCLSELAGAKIALVFEVAPGDPFVLCPADVFDAYCVLDPSLKYPDRRVYSFPRPLEIASNPLPYTEKEVPVIGSFGFATPGKGFDLVVDAVNREFEEAIVRFNIPYGTYVDDAYRDLHKQNYADYLADLCRRTAREGVEVIVTRDYMSKEDLIAWCGQNTLNCFLYNRNQPGLAATTDQAISSGRPLAVSQNDTFRHIHQYVTPYPCRSLAESIAVSQAEVFRMQQDWSSSRFAERFKMLLDDLGVFSKLQDKPSQFGSFELSVHKPKSWLRLKLDRYLHLMNKIINKLFKKRVVSA